MAEKLRPLGICDNCGGPISPSQWYTSKGTPRLHCCVDCRNAANSHAGEPVRHAKLLDRLAAGEWQNPAKLRPPTPTEQAQRARKGRLREVAEGRWRNPALDDAARQKLSTPRKHTGPLASAIEKLGRGLSTQDLTPEEQAAHRAYQQALRDARRDQINALARANYRKRQARKKAEKK